MREILKQKTFFNNKKEHVSFFFFNSRAAQVECETLWKIIKTRSKASQIYLLFFFLLNNFVVGSLLYYAITSSSFMVSGVRAREWWWNPWREFDTNRIIYIIILDLTGEDVAQRARLKWYHQSENKHYIKFTNSSQSFRWFHSSTLKDSQRCWNDRDRPSSEN